MQNIKQTQEKLDAVSGCFCLAKWTSVTMHLESGTTHSCHHPKVHQVPLEELQNNFRALHNTDYKIQQRKKMIEGERPAECEYCWNIEDLGTNEVSDRVLKSASSWSIGEYEAIVRDPLSPLYKPRYVEVSFSHACQFKCSYCSANYSTTWEEELKKFGEYPTMSGQKDVTTFAEDVNPYIKAFWEWWPELKKGLHTFRITGGEPLLSPSTFRVLESLIANPEPRLNLAVNSNLGAPPVLMDKFTALTEKLLSGKSVAKFEIYTSIDAFGRQAEYIRHGLDQQRFWQNMEKILSVHPEARISIMCTFNALSLTSYLPLLENIIQLNLKYRNDLRKLPVYLDISYLRYPDYQTVQVLPAEYLTKMEEIVQYVSDHQWQKTPHHAGFHEDQLIKSRRILEWMKLPLAEGVKEERQKNFYRFFSEHDRRRNVDFLQAFPEMEDFWNLCKDLAETPPPPEDPPPEETPPSASEESSSSG